MAIPVFQDGRAAILACQDGRLAIPTFLRRKRTLLVLCFPCGRHALPAARSLAKMALPSREVKMAALPSWEVRMGAVPSRKVKMAILVCGMAIPYLCPTAIMVSWPSRILRMAECTIFNRKDGSLLHAKTGGDWLAIFEVPSTFLCLHSGVVERHSCRWLQ